jgi:3-phenylpropionate/trans-cinnamate dioxygenase ferredoxin reductase subunit
MSSEVFVIIGTGRAGSRAAEALRDDGFAGRIVLVGEEAHAPYDRPPLSKHRLFDPAGSGWLYGADYFTERQIDVRYGAPVTSIDRSAHQVVFASGERLAYDRLLLATGSHSRRLDLPGGTLAGIHTLRTLDDSRAIAPLLRPGRRLVVVGGGLIGLEVAAGAIRREMIVTVIEAAPRLMARAVPSEIAAAVECEHRGNGVAFRFEAALASFEGDAVVEAVCLADGSRIAADLVLVAIGAVPCIELARDAGLRVDSGIVVDATLRSSDPNIFAAGDVSSFHHVLFGRRLRLEHWNNAQEQGRHAAASMLGGAKPFAVVPWFWSDQYERSIQGAGMCDSASGVMRPLVGGGRSIFYVRPQGSLIGASAFGPAGVVGRTISLARKMIAGRIAADARALADPGIDLKAMLLGAPVP